MAFKKLSPEVAERAESFWNTYVVGDCLEGVLLRYIPPQKKKSYGFYVIRTSKSVIGANDCYAIGSVLRTDFDDLNSKLKPEYVGKLIRLTFHGIKDLPSGNTLKDFTVEVDEDGDVPF